CVTCRKALHGPAEVRAAKVVAMPGRSFSVKRYAVAASVLAACAAGWFTYDRFSPGPGGNRATLQLAEGSVYRFQSGQLQPVSTGARVREGEVLRTGAGSWAVLRLVDGSTLEVGERAELSIATSRKDTTVNLDRGALIVQAAKRRTGHLYVISSDCRVAVTGTVFSVNRGTKGSRVSVVEGEVQVEHGSRKDILHSGDQVATHSSMGAVLVEDEIAWSRNLADHMVLLREFGKLKTKLEAVPMPGLRYHSRLLDAVPANTLVFVSVPNLGQALNEANRLFQDQLAQSDVLRNWWGSRNQQELQRSTDMIYRQSISKRDRLGWVANPEPARW
ncbi:MAG: FecR domain-containing protein, partial [Bryobacteraceae bacterium]